jgi:hypothetical protein
MRTTCLLFLTIGWVALAHGTGYTAAPGPADEGKHQAGGAATDAERARGRTYDTNRRPGQASLIKARRPPQLPNGRQHFLAGNALRQPRSSRFGGAAKGGLIPSETARSEMAQSETVRGATVHGALPVRTSSVFRPTGLPGGPSLDNGGHRGPNPAVIGGVATRNSRNTGAINGTGMSRRP